MSMLIALIIGIAIGVSVGVFLTQNKNANSVATNHDDDFLELDYRKFHLSVTNGDTAGVYYMTVNKKGLFSNKTVLNMTVKKQNICDVLMIAKEMGYINPESEMLILTKFEG